VESRRLWERPPTTSPDFVRPVVAVPWSRPTMWIDPTSFAAAPERAEVQLQGLHAVVVGPAQTLPDVPIPIGKAESRGMSATFSGTVDSGGVVAGTLRVLLRGEDADLWRSALQRATLESASGALQGLASQLLFTAET